MYVWCRVSWPQFDNLFLIIKLRSTHFTSYMYFILELANPRGINNIPRPLRVVLTFEFWSKSENLKMCWLWPKVEEVYKYGTIPSSFALWLKLGCQNARQFWCGWVQTDQKGWKTEMKKNGRLTRHFWSESKNIYLACLMCFGQVSPYICGRACSVFVDFL